MTEGKLRATLAVLRGVRVDAIECRSTLCRFTLSGTSAALGKAIDELGAKHELHAGAQAVVLGAPQGNGDGMAIVAHARFAR
jgi:hypothetical protein